MVQALVIANALSQKLFAQYPETIFSGMPDALDTLFLKQFDVIFVDIAIPGQEGLRLLELARISGAELVICHTPLEDITEALWYGVRFFIKNTATAQQLEILLKSIVERRTALAELEKLPEKGDSDVLGQIIGEPSVMISHKVLAYALSTDPIMIIGAPGTEWFFIAQLLKKHTQYSRSLRYHQCTSTADLLDLSFLYPAHHGVIIIGDVAYFDADMQVQLQALIEHRPIPVQLCIHSSKSLRAAVAAGRFSESLYRLISKREITVPSLRDRDVADVIQRTLTLVNTRLGRNAALDDEAYALLLAYSWPGNLQELYGVMHAVLAAYNVPLITANLLPDKIKKA